MLVEEMGTRGSGKQRIGKSFKSVNQQNIIQAARWIIINLRGIKEM